MADDVPPAAPRGSSLPSHLESRVEAILRAAEDHAERIQRDMQAQRNLAESEARRHLADAQRRADSVADQRIQRLRELTDGLLERAETLAREFDAFSEALVRATAAVETGGELATAPEPAAERARAPGPATEYARGPQPEPIRLPPRLRPVGPPVPEREPPLAPRRPPPSAPLAPPPIVPQSGRARRAAAASPPRAPEHDAARLVAIEMAAGGMTREEVARHLREAFRLDDTDALLNDVFGGRTPGSGRVPWRS